MYRIPLPKDVQVVISKPSGEYAHENNSKTKYAVDFLVGVGTPVLASRDGIVVKIKSDSDKWGLDIKFANHVNFVAVAHKDGVFTEYLHLGKDKILVDVGQKVNAGDSLALTGLSGCMDKPHLHFNVFKIRDGKAYSEPVNFVICHSPQKRFDFKIH